MNNREYARREEALDHCYNDLVKELVDYFTTERNLSEFAVTHAPYSATQHLKPDVSECKEPVSSPANTEQQVLTLGGHTATVAGLDAIYNEFSKCDLDTSVLALLTVPAFFETARLYYPEHSASRMTNLQVLERLTEALANSGSVHSGLAQVQTMEFSRNIGQRPSNN